MARVCHGRDLFWKIANEERMEAHSLFEHVYSDSLSDNIPLDHHKYMTHFLDQKEAESILLNLNAFENEESKS